MKVMVLFSKKKIYFVFIAQEVFKTHFLMDFQLKILNF
jgi:hypothetical protein